MDTPRNVPIGYIHYTDANGICMHADAGWEHFRHGAILSKAEYPKLYAALNAAHPGYFNNLAARYFQLPDLRGKALLSPPMLSEAEARELEKSDESRPIVEHDTKRQELRLSAGDYRVEYGGKFTQRISHSREFRLPLRAEGTYEDVTRVVRLMDFGAKGTTVWEKGYVLVLEAPNTEATKAAPGKPMDYESAKSKPAAKVPHKFQVGDMVWWTHTLYGGDRLTTTGLITRIREWDAITVRMNRTGELVLCGPEHLTLVESAAPALKEMPESSGATRVNAPTEDSVGPVVADQNLPSSKIGHRESEDVGEAPHRQTKSGSGLSESDKQLRASGVVSAPAPSRGLWQDGIKLRASSPGLLPRETRVHDPKAISNPLDDTWVRWQIAPLPGAFGR